MTHPGNLSDEIQISRTTAMGIAACAIAILVGIYFGIKNNKKFGYYLLLFLIIAPTVGTAMRMVGIAALGKED